MPKRFHATAAFGFGVTFVLMCIVIAVFEPYPSPFLYFVTRVTLALAAAGVAVVLPGLLEVQLRSQIKAAGALAVFCVVYFFSPADLARRGTPTDVDGVFLVQSSEDAETTKYYWKQAKASFSVPNKRWNVATKAAQSGLGDVWFDHRAVGDAHIRLHVSLLNLDRLGSFNERTVSTYRENIGHLGGFHSREIMIGGQPGLLINARIKGEVHGLKSIWLAFLPNADGRLLEFHLTYNLDDPAEAQLVDDYQNILNSIELENA